MAKKAKLLNNDENMARKHFAQEGLPFPFIPAKMRPAFVEVSEWVYGTRLDAPWLYEINKFVLEAGTKKMQDYVLLGHAGQGIQSYAIHYYLVYGPLAIFIQIGWGGAYTDNEAAIREMSVRFTQAKELIQAVEAAPQAGRFQSGERLIISVSEFHDSFWMWTKGALNEDSFPKTDWHKNKDVLGAALAEVQGGKSRF